jgi:inhibitor of lysozyme (Ivy)
MVFWAQSQQPPLKFSVPPLPLFGSALRSRDNSRAATVIVISRSFDNSDKGIRMNAIRWLIRGATAALVAAGAPAWSQNTLDAQALKLYGGNYSSDCSNSAAPRLRVVADALMVEQGTKRLTGGNVKAAYSYFGQSPPPDYQVVLLSEVRGGSQLMFIVFRDKSGQYITLDGDPKVKAALGKALLERKYRGCDATSKETTTSAAASAVHSKPMVGPTELLTDPKFKSAYYKALGPKVKENWLAQLDGPSPPIKKINVAGTEYIFASACKNHDCGDNNTVLLYSAAQGVVYGKIVQQRRATLIGAPPPAVASELDRLWVAEWRQKQ